MVRNSANRGVYILGSLAAKFSVKSVVRPVACRYYMCRESGLKDHRQGVNSSETNIANSLEGTSNWFGSFWVLVFVCWSRRSGLLTDNFLKS